MGVHPNAREGGQGRTAGGWSEDELTTPLSHTGGTETGASKVDSTHGREKGDGIESVRREETREVATEGSPKHRYSRGRSHERA